MTAVYIAGPMSDYDEFNFPAFFAAEELLRSVGYEVLNPATNPPCESWRDYMRASIGQVIRADGVAVLADWQMSVGACLEVHIAHTLRLPVLPLNRWLTPSTLLRKTL